MALRIFNAIDNYIYLYHIDKFIVIPTFPDQLNDTMSVNFNKSTPMSRSAPIYSYSDSGPRTMQFNITLHRDMMTEINHGVSNYPVPVGDDYVDIMAREIQAIALPAYNSSNKVVDPPLIAVKIGKEVFIKGVVTGNVGVTYEYPILETDKFAQVMISFNVEEIEPYDANSVIQVGSYRGLDTTLERNLYKRGV